MKPILPGPRHLTRDIIDPLRQALGGQLRLKAKGMDSAEPFAFATVESGMVESGMVACNIASAYNIPLCFSLGMNITVSDVSFGYTQAQSVLQSLNFLVEHNRITGILGSSGSGKSTLLRLLCGILPNSPHNAFRGTVKLDDLRPISQMRREGRIGFMFQEPSLLPNLTVAENIQFPLDILHQDNDRAVNALLETVGLADFRNYRPKHLSGGMQTRTALARTFVTKPDLLLLDEPFSALDYGWKMDLYSHLSGLIRGSSTTVVMVSHDINELLLLANRVILLSKSGQIIRSVDLSMPKPASFASAELAAYFDAVKHETLLFQDALMEERRLLRPC